MSSLTEYDEKSPSFREGVNHHPYFLANILTFLLKNKYF